jgi:hypothetical protein
MSTLRCLEVDKKIGELLKMRMTLLMSLKPYDDKQADAAAEKRRR